MNAQHKPSGSSMPTLTLTPMSKSQAGKLVKQMLGSYPSLSLHDPQTYVASVVTLLTKYPVWAGDSAIMRALSGDECKFIPPTVGILRPLLESEVRVHRYAAEWDHRAHDQVLLALAPPKDEPEVRRAFIAKRRAELGPYFGLQGTQPKQQTREQAAAEVIAVIGQEAFDAIPDAGYDWKKLTPPKIGDA